MGDVFLEYIVKQKANGKTMLYRIGVVVAVIFLTFVLLMSSGYISKIPLIGNLLPALFIGVCYVAYRIISGLSYEFEYIVTNGELDIDRIAARRSRVRVFNARPSEVEVLAPLDIKYKDKYESGTFAKTIDASSSKTSENRWFIITNTTKHGRVRVIFEPTEKMVENMRSYMPDKVFKA